MIKVLRLKKGIIAIVLAVIAFIAAQVMSSNHADGSNTVLGVSGGLLILGSLIFLYPILFAKKTENNDEEVELKPINKDPAVDDSVTS